MLIMTFMGATCMTKAGAQACLSLCYICYCELKRLFSITQLLNGMGHPLSHLIYYNVHVFGQHIQTTSGTIQLLNFLGNMAATKIVFTFIVIIS